MQKIRVILASLVLALVVASPSLAAVEVEGSAYAGYFDKYLWRGYDLSGGSPVVQGGVNLSSNGFTLGYWTNIQTKTDVGAGLNGGDASETDITLDYTFSPMEMLSVSVGNIWYALDGLEDTKELYLGLGLDLPAAPALKVYYDYDMADENGLFYTGAVSHSIDLAENLSLGLGALVSFNDKSDYAVGNYSGWHNYELGASATYAVTDQLSITPSLLFSSPISDEAKIAIDSETLAGITATFSF